MNTLSHPYLPRRQSTKIIPMPQPLLVAAPEPEFSYFDFCTDKIPSDHLTTQSFLEGVKNGRWRPEVEACRQTCPATIINSVGDN